MASSTVPAASSSGKTQYRVSLTSGTSYTVPAGVTYLNVTLYGAGGGTGNCTTDTATTNNGGTGGTTTFTGATSALGGGGGKWARTAATGAALAIQGNTGLAGTANSGMPAAPAFLNGYYTASVNQFYMAGGLALAGQIIPSTLTATAGGSITYAIGAGGTAGADVSGSGYAGAIGGSGRIDVEYWA